MRERDAGLERRGLGILAFVSMTVAWGVLPAAQGPVERPGRAVAESRSPVAEDYVIAVDDELDLYVLDMPEISRLYRVSPTGARQKCDGLGGSGSILPVVLELSAQTIAA